MVAVHLYGFGSDARGVIDSLKVALNTRLLSNNVHLLDRIRLINNAAFETYDMRVRPCSWIEIESSLDQDGATVFEIISGMDHHPEVVRKIVYCARAAAK